MTTSWIVLVRHWVRRRSRPPCARRWRWRAAVTRESSTSSCWRRFLVCPQIFVTTLGGQGVDDRLPRRHLCPQPGGSVGGRRRAGEGPPSVRVPVDLWPRLAGDRVQRSKRRRVAGGPHGPGRAT